MLEWVYSTLACCKDDVLADCLDLLARNSGDTHLWIVNWNTELYRSPSAIALTKLKRTSGTNASAASVDRFDTAAEAASVFRTLCTTLCSWQEAPKRILLSFGFELAVLVFLSSSSAAHSSWASEIFCNAHISLIVVVCRVSDRILFSSMSITWPRACLASTSYRSSSSTAYLVRFCRLFLFTYNVKFYDYLISFAMASAPSSSNTTRPWPRILAASRRLYSASYVTHWVCFSWTRLFVRSGLVSWQIIQQFWSVCLSSDLLWRWQAAEDTWPHSSPIFSSNAWGLFDFFLGGVSLSPCPAALRFRCRELLVLDIANTSSQTLFQLLQREQKKEKELADLPWSCPWIDAWGDSCQ